jgi:hypothetical protein
LPPAAAGYLVQTASGTATAASTGFIVACGPPETPANDDCLYVGVYGDTRVTSMAFPNQPVTIGPRSFTRVIPNQLPTAPEPLSEDRFLVLLDRTTVIGTGSPADRLDFSNVSPPEIRARWGPAPRPAANPQPELLDQPPPPQEGLPDPPRPPDLLGIIGGEGR